MSILISLSLAAAVYAFYYISRWLWFHLFGLR